MFPTMWSVLDKNKTPSESDINKIQSFVFCRWLTGNPKTIKDANIFNIYYDIPVFNQYMYIKNLHSGKIRNIKYIKSEKEEDNVDISIIQKHFNINFTKAKEYLNFISEEELKYLKDLYASHASYTFKK